MNRGRRSEPRIVDPATHPRRTVCLRVAAEYLEIDERTLQTRIDDGKLKAFRDGRVCRIEVVELVAYLRSNMEAET
jgi:excisionase family DNA binding protein